MGRVVLNSLRPCNCGKHRFFYILQDEGNFKFQRVISLSVSNMFRFTIVHNRWLKNLQVNFPPWRDARMACAERSRSDRVVLNPCAIAIRLSAL